MKWTNAIISDFRREPWGKDGEEHLKADVRFPAKNPGFLGRLIGATVRPEQRGVVVLENEDHDATWFWEESCRGVSAGLSMDLKDAYEQHERLLEAGKEGI